MADADVEEKIHEHCAFDARKPKTKEKSSSPQSRSASMGRVSSNPKNEKRTITKKQKDTAKSLTNVDETNQELTNKNEPNEKCDGTPSSSELTDSVSSTSKTQTKKGLKKTVRSYNLKTRDSQKTPDETANSMLLNTVRSNLIKNSSSAILSSAGTDSVVPDIFLHISSWLNNYAVPATPEIFDKYHKNYVVNDLLQKYAQSPHENHLTSDLRQRDVSSLLICALNNLPSSLIPSNYYYTFIHAVCVLKTKDRTKQLKVALCFLPTSQRDLILMLSTYFRKSCVSVEKIVETFVHYYLRPPKGFPRHSKEFDVVFLLVKQSNYLSFYSKHTSSVAYGHFTKNWSFSITEENAVPLLQASAKVDLKDDGTTTIQAKQGELIKLFALIDEGLVIAICDTKESDIENEKENEKEKSEKENENEKEKEKEKEKERKVIKKEKSRIEKLESKFSGSVGCCLLSDLQLVTYDIYDVPQDESQTILSCQPKTPTKRKTINEVRGATLNPRTAKSMLSPGYLHSKRKSSHKLENIFVVSSSSSPKQEKKRSTRPKRTSKQRNERDSEQIDMKKSPDSESVDYQKALSDVDVKISYESDGGKTLQTSIIGNSPLILESIPALQVDDSSTFSIHSEKKKRRKKKKEKEADFAIEPIKSKEELSIEVEEANVDKQTIEIVIENGKKIEEIENEIASIEESATTLKKEMLQPPLPPPPFSLTQSNKPDQLSQKAPVLRDILPPPIKSPSSSSHHSSEENTRIIRSNTTSFSSPPLLPYTPRTESVDKLTPPENINNTNNVKLKPSNVPFLPPPPLPLDQKKMPPSPLFEEKLPNDWKDMNEQQKAFVDTMRQKRMNVTKELLETEHTYVSQMKLFSENYVEPIRKNGYGLEKDTSFKIFANFDFIFSFHRDKMLPQLLDFGSTWSVDVCISPIFERALPKLSLYYHYVNNHGVAMRIVQKSVNKIKRFRKFIADTDYHDSVAGLCFESLLILPVQRIPRYQLLLSELRDCTPKQHPDYKRLENCVIEYTSLAEKLNEAKERKNNEELKNDIIKRLEGFVNIPSAVDRIFYKTAPISLNKEKAFVFLFTDIAVFTKPKHGSKYPVKYTVPLSTCSIQPDVDRLNLFTPTVTEGLRISFSSPSERKEIESLFKELILHSQTRLFSSNEMVSLSHAGLKSYLAEEEEHGRQSIANKFAKKLQERVKELEHLNEYIAAIREERQKTNPSISENDATAIISTIPSITESFEKLDNIIKERANSWKKETTIVDLFEDNKSLEAYKEYSLNFERQIQAARNIMIDLSTQTSHEKEGKVTESSDRRSRRESQSISKLPKFLEQVSKRIKSDKSFMTLLASPLAHISDFFVHLKDMYNVSLTFADHKRLEQALQNLKVLNADIEATTRGSKYAK